MPLAYFDHNATTPLDERVVAAMLPYFREHYGNPSSRHEYGREARRAVDTAREQVAQAVGAHPSQVLFCSGGSEANNLAIKGGTAYLSPAQVVVSAIEHPCVAKPARELQERGWTCRTVAVSPHGEISTDDLKSALESPTGLVCAMLANNETGVVQDISGLSEIAQERGALLHTDAVQALGKIKIDFAALGVDSLSISAHKAYGPKGVGALVVGRRVDLKAQISGAGHEKGLRAGTENVPGIVGFGMACELAVRQLADYENRIGALRDEFERELSALGATIFGSSARRLANTSFFAFPRIEGETLVMALDNVGYAVASGAACSSGTASATLLAMGVDNQLGRGAVRVSLGRDTTGAQVGGLLRALQNEVARLRGLSAMKV
ncbi:MAG: cysteine desulfurase [Sulfuricella sp.]|nr:cysteine desulfurase [Sulfuricella sp.]